MKRFLVWAALAALVISSQAFAASTISYFLGLGGDNHVAEYEGNSSYYPPFDTSGPDWTEADNETFIASQNLTWNVRVMLAGQQVGGDSAGKVPSGVANFVFNLELWTWTGSEVGNRVSSTVFHSTIHDGVADGARGVAHGVEEKHWAAFTFVYDIDDRGVTDAPGRVIDDIQDGGPGLTKKQYPSKKGDADSIPEPYAASALEGQLLGMGAGYPEYISAGCIYGGGCGNPGWYYFGVGMDAIDPTYGETYDPLGSDVPIAEGQIDTRGLLAGNYILKLTAKKGTANVSQNILEGDFDPDTATPAEFASLADAVIEDSIIFAVAYDPGSQEGCCMDDYSCQNLPPAVCTAMDGEPQGTGTVCLGDNNSNGMDDLCEPCTPPVVTGAKSVKVHGSKGPFPITMPLTAPYATEPRMFAPAYASSIEVVFDQEIDISAAVVGLSSGAKGTLDKKQTVVLNDTLVIPITSAPTNNACLTITVNGVKDVVTGECVMAEKVLKLTVLKGDVASQWLLVNGDDLSAVKGQLFKSVVTGNFTKDVQPDGTINGDDLSAVKSNLFKSATCGS